MQLQPTPQQLVPAIECAGAEVLVGEGLSISFGGHKVLDQASCSLRQGEVVLLRGENGSGKTTLLNILTGNLDPDAGTIQYCLQGTTTVRRFPRRRLRDHHLFGKFGPEKIARRGFGRTWQDVRLFGSHSLRDNLAVADPQNSGESPLRALLTPGDAAKDESNATRRASDLLTRIGLASRADSSADKVSLGQSKRIAIARAVASGAKVLFLDEPLAGLDQQGISDVLATLADLVANANLTLVIIEHELAQHALAGLVTSEWHLVDGKISRSRLAAMSHPGSSPKGEELHAAAGKSGPQAWPVILERLGWQPSREPLLRNARLTRLQPPSRSSPTGGLVLNIKGLVVHRNRRIALGLDDDGVVAGFDLQIAEGEIVVLEAPNGWGKSTLFDALCGILPASAGSISLKGVPADDMPTWQRARMGISACPSAAALFDTLTVEETQRIAGSENSAFFPGIRLEPGLRVNQLSGGQQRLLALSTAFASARRLPGLLVLDEPLAMLDAKAVHTVLESLHALACTTLILAPATIH